MLLIGICFLVFAALLQWTSMSIVGAAALVGAVAVALGLILGERLPSK